MTNGFLRVAAVSPEVRVADVDFNVGQIIALIDRLEKDGVEIAVFPELCVTAYTCADLFHSAELLGAAQTGIKKLLKATEGHDITIIVGLPIYDGGAVWNCAAIISHGSYDLIRKSYIPNYNEFYERRWFAPDAHDSQQIVEACGVRIGVEICEDLWVTIPPSCHLTLAGADVVFNLSASDELIGKWQYTRSLVMQQSARCICGYVYTSAGRGESSTDLMFTGRGIIAERGTSLGEFDARTDSDCYICADIDIEAIRRDRMHTTTFADCARANGIRSQIPAGVISTEPMDLTHRLRRQVDPHPFVPSDPEHRAERCREIVGIQTAALAQRLSAIHCSSLVIGISGGLDSTLALLVAERTFRHLGIPVEQIVGVTMPGFGTTGRTYENALTLMRRLGVTIREIPIADAVMRHFRDIAHDPECHDVTYENSQARERTQILMDIANQSGGIVLGTGDLSELALGWATYNGDHMSMYGINAGVPKTLVRYLVEWFADETTDNGFSAALKDVADTPISPELIPADTDGNIKQRTEDLVGPYELHDFFLYYTLRFGFRPSRIFYLAHHAFDGAYTDGVILRWLREFFRRFFQQQFKRSCLPDGPKVGSVCLSPRGDWRMPSDASSALWLAEIDALIKETLQEYQGKDTPKTLYGT